MTGGRNCPGDWLEYLEGELAEAERLRMAEHLQHCPACRQTLAAERELLERLRSTSPELETADLVPALRRRLGEIAVDEKPSWRLPRWAAAGALVLAAVVAVWWLRSDDDVRTKGGDAAAERWAGIQAWIVDGQGKSQPLRESLRPRAHLAFSYTNLGEQPFAYLMIFGVDSTGRTWWFHPAYLKAGENPAALPIAAGVQDRELPQKIELAAPPGRLRLVGLFTREPVRVLEVESLVSRLVREGGFWNLERLPVPDSAQQFIDLEVVP